MGKYCKEIGKWVMKVVSCEMKEVIPLTADENGYHERQSKCFICDKRFCYDKNDKSFKIF